MTLWIEGQDDVSTHLIAAVVLNAIVVPASSSTAAEITVWTTRALATVLAEIGGEFERETGHKLVVTSDLPPAFARRAREGQPFDLLITGSAPLDEWIKEGRIVAATRTDLARSGIGVEVRAGAPKPDISSVDAFKRALLSARSIAYLRVGSGIYLHRLFDKLGIAAKLSKPNSHAPIPTSSLSSSRRVKSKSA